MGMCYLKIPVTSLEMDGECMKLDTILIINVIHQIPQDLVVNWACRL